MAIPHDYDERVYAGVLGKIIGVYLGRPFEGWSYDRIMERLGEVDYYVNDRLNAPLIVTDDDISGTFTFVRALEDYGSGRDLTARQVGNTWLNYVIEGRTIFWWGGMGNSTEHTAFLRLKAGVPAPESGSIALNGKVVAEQIGAQIFIDAWALVCPGEPELAVELAGKAASVGHDGEAVYGAQALAAMEAQAFVESDRFRLLDVATALIPRDSIICRMIGDIREWHAKDGDWRRTRERIVADYGYDKYGGNCHMVPNHALIVLGLLYGNDDFQRSLMITNTCGWDTDCNSGNIGCLMGIKGGLAGLDAGPDWRGPVADRIFLPTADGGRALTDAANEALYIARLGRSLDGESWEEPKEGARFHFSLPGSAQGFLPDDGPDCRGTTAVENVGSRLAIRYRGVGFGRDARAATATFVPPEAISLGGYSLVASPTLYPGQTVTANVQAESENSGPVNCCVYVSVYGEDNRLTIRRSDAVSLAPGARHAFRWRVPADCHPICRVGIEVASVKRADGVVLLDSLTWDGTPDLRLGKGPLGGGMWQRAWVNAADSPGFIGADMPTVRIMQNHDTGMLIQGTREWSGYTVSATVEPHLAVSAGIAACVQGLRRYYALLLCDGRALRLVKELDGRTTLVEKPFAWELDARYDLALRTDGNTLTALVGGESVFTVTDDDRPLLSGAIALLCEVGRVDFGNITVQPV
ncbi:ADP-ribosylglycohydrolase family protein [Candidatus Poribacteria bacterium]|nr:ADP-ribosylglycohydrolase family protein [Candidatus Poribacteria bacterium]